MPNKLNLIDMLINTREGKLLTNQTEFFGIWRGIVEWNHDPLDIGRVKVRVHQIYGYIEDVREGVGIKTELLPWAMPCFMGGGTYDSGSYDIPLIGAMVWVEFEQGDPDRPVWKGGFPAIPEKVQEMNTIKNRNVPSGKHISMGTWYSKTKNDAPKEIQDLPENEPTRRVMFKTPKGTTLYVEDKDGSEFLRIVDRIGQTIEMNSPVTILENKGNKSQRGTGMSVDQTPAEDPSSGVSPQKTQLDVNTKAVNKKAWIKLKDARGQYIELRSEYNKEKIIVKGYCGHNVILDSTSGSEKIRIEDKNNNFIELDAVTDNRNDEIKNNWNIHVAGTTNMDLEGDINIKSNGILNADISGATLVMGNGQIDLN